jgi:uncharacterized protein (DUF302 family)
MIFFKQEHAMSYTFSKSLDMHFEAAVERVTEELKKEGFGVLTDIDVQTTLKNKIGVDVQKYRILGACNPGFAHQALQAEPEIGVMLPCNVVVRETETGVQVSAVDPVASMQAVNNPSLGGIATQVRDKLRSVIDSL